MSATTTTDELNLIVCPNTYEIVFLFYLFPKNSFRINKNKSYQKRKNNWRCRGSNPGPFTCKANALPLSYIPMLLNLQSVNLSSLETILSNRALTSGPA